jgi:hypothetical protein
VDNIFKSPLLIGGRDYLSFNFLSAGFKSDIYIVKVVEDSLYSVVTALVVTLLLLIFTAKFPLDELQDIVKKALEDIEYMLTISRQL